MWEAMTWGKAKRVTERYGDNIGTLIDWPLKNRTLI